MAGRRRDAVVAQQGGDDVEGCTLRQLGPAGAAQAVRGVADDPGRGEQAGDTRPQRSATDAEHRPRPRRRPRLDHPPGDGHHRRPCALAVDDEQLIVTVEVVGVERCDLADPQAAGELQLDEEVVGRSGDRTTEGDDLGGVEDLRWGARHPGRGDQSARVVRADTGVDEPVEEAADGDQVRPKKERK